MKPSVTVFRLVDKVAEIEYVSIAVILSPSTEISSLRSIQGENSIQLFLSFATTWLSSPF